MINIDSEDSSVVTVSCAGGSDFAVKFPIVRKNMHGRKIVLEIKGLKGGHSGVEINSGRVNANTLMGRILHHLSALCQFDIISIDGGDKGNAIPLSCTAILCVDDGESFIAQCNKYAEIIHEEIKARESGFSWVVEQQETGEFSVMNSQLKEQIIHTLILAPNGVIEMSAEIENLVETSLNLGIFKTDIDSVNILFALRSNKSTALSYLENRLKAFFAVMNCTVETGGVYPPWEYKKDSSLRDAYLEMYRAKKGQTPRVEAIHAGLECGVFAAAIPDFDCISIGPEMHGIHTTKEEVSIKSTKEIYDILLSVLENLK